MIKVAGNVIIVLVREDGGKEVQTTRNIVTNEGDKFYAQRICGETPTYNFNTIVLGNGTQPTWSKTSTYGTLNGAISASMKAVASGYPRTNDDDPDNAGAGPNIVTWKFVWSGGDFSAVNVNQAVITVGNPSSNSPILTGFNITPPRNKALNDILKIFVNHVITGT